MSLGKYGSSLAATLALLLSSPPASAHWCDDLWASSYNIVVRPESDTVAVPASGSANLNVEVQNNMGYQLINFVLRAETPDTTISAVPPSTLKIANTLLPAEKGIWQLTLSRSGSGSVRIEDITFSVSFGDEGQSSCYPLNDGSPVMVIKTDNALVPSKPAGLDNPEGNCGEMTQARDLQYQAIAEFDDLDLGLDKLMNFYCSGRASWGATDGVIPTYCRNATSTTCPSSTPSGGGTKYEYIHLWAAGELALRKSALGSRTAVLRARLQCGANDSDPVFGGYAMFMLGYLGEDPTARQFLQSQAAGAGDLAAIAKASLLLMGNPDDLTQYQSDVSAGLASGSGPVAAASAAALGIVNRDDGAITNTLLPLVQWIEPDTADDGKAMFAAHLLAVVAWDRRQWSATHSYSGNVSFYGEGSAGMGGIPGTGGMVGAGGTPGTGGMVGTGGTMESGGATGAVDAAETGGAMGTGGQVGTGGVLGTGGNLVRETGGAQGGGGVQQSGGIRGSGGFGAAGGISSGGTGGLANPRLDASMSAGGGLGAGGVRGSDAPATMGADARDLAVMLGSDAKERDAWTTTSDLAIAARDATIGVVQDPSDGASTPAPAQDGASLAVPDTTGTSNCRCNLGRGHAGKDGSWLWLLLATLWLGRQRKAKRRSLESKPQRGPS